MLTAADVMTTGVVSMGRTCRRETSPSFSTPAGCSAGAPSDENLFSFSAPRQLWTE
jgi:hypothetical protein